MEEKEHSAQFTQNDRILEMQHITKVFPGVIALDDVDLEVRRGEVHALVGENGAGKSTLMKILAGAYQPDKGRILLRGQEVTFHHPHDAQRAGISIIYQELNLLPERTVVQNIFLGREMRNWWGIDHKKMSLETEKLLESLGIAIPGNTLVRNLSIAQQQQVEIAKALSLNAEILIMDEPTASLAPRETQHLFELVERLKNNGVTVIYISHRLEEIFQIADRVTVLKDGKRVATENVRDISSSQLVQLMVGRELDVLFPPKAKPEEIGEVVLEAENLTCGNRVKNFSLKLRRGEIVCLAGLEGSGRTHVARALFGLERIDKGTVRLNGRAVYFHDPRKAIQSGLGFITEDRKQEGLILIQSVRNNIALPSLDERQRMGFIEGAKEEEAVRRSIESLDLRAPNDQIQVQYLSGGNQQKAVLAKWLLTDANILIFDEPTRGIDVGAKAGIHQLMRRLAREGKAILMISSELPEVVGMSDRVIVMNQGTIAAEFPGEGLNEDIIIEAIAKVSQNDRKNHFAQETVQ